MKKIVVIFLFLSHQLLAISNRCENKIFETEHNLKINNYFVIQKSTERILKSLPRFKNYKQKLVALHVLAYVFEEVESELVNKMSAILKINVANNHEYKKNKLIISQINNLIIQKISNFTDVDTIYNIWCELESFFQRRFHEEIDILPSVKIFMPQEQLLKSAKSIFQYLYISKLFECHFESQVPFFEYIVLKYSHLVFDNLSDLDEIYMASSPDGWGSWNPNLQIYLKLFQNFSTFE